MPKKKTPTGVEYEVTGKKFTWHPEDDSGKRGALEPVVIPMRVKLKTIRLIADRELDVAAMFAILESLVPDQAGALDEMDLNDFQACFTAWQEEYTALAGATPGE